MWAVIVNTIAIIAGTTVGLLLRRGLPDSITDAVRKRSACAQSSSAFKEPSSNKTSCSSSLQRLSAWRLAKRAISTDT